MFDDVKHEQLLKILHKTKILKSRDVWQAYFLSTFLFNVYSEEKFRKELEETNEGIKKKLQYLIEEIQRVSEEYGLKYNNKK